MYLAVSPHAISTFLFKEEGVAQLPVCNISHTLRGAVVRYPQVEMLAFSLVIAARRLCPYFQDYSIKVLTKSPLTKVLQRLDSSRRLVGWLVELNEFDIEYLPRKHFVTGEGLSVLVWREHFHETFGVDSKEGFNGEMASWPWLGKGDP